MLTTARNIRFSQLMLFSPFLLCLCLPSATTADEKDESETKKAIAKDLKLYQGTWELLPTAANSLKYRSVKTIKGNTSTIRRYDIDTGELVREHTSTFELLIDGGVRVNRFRIGTGRGRGFAYIYKVDDQYFYEATGLLQKDEYRTYTREPKLFRWKRTADSAAPETTRASSDK